MAAHPVQVMIVVVVFTSLFTRKSLKNKWRLE